MVVLVIVVTIKNESPVEMVLNSTCESLCFLVTKIFNKLVFLLSAIRDCEENSPCIRYVHFFCVVYYYFLFLPYLPSSLGFGRSNVAVQCCQ